MTREQEQRHFIDSTDFSDAHMQPLGSDASFRRYVRVSKDDSTAMLMDAPTDKEDTAPFIAVAKHLHGAGYSVPALLASDVKAGFLLLEDIGDDSFTRLLKQEESVSETMLYEAAVDVLVAWHDSEHGVADTKKLPLPAYDEALLLREVELFANWFLPQVMGKEKASSLYDEYMALWKNIIGSASLSTNQFVHRDYHADNLMWLPERDGHKRVGVLDFQDAVYGDAAYDLVSLLEDARRDVSAELAQKMIARYVERASVDEQQLYLAYALLGAQRNSKIVGIFTRLAARDGKQHYLDYLPRVWKHLEHDLSHPSLAELRGWLDKHVDTKWRGVISIMHDATDLALTA